jgi:hypothetical protein
MGELLEGDRPVLVVVIDRELFRHVPAGIAGLLFYLFTREKDDGNYVSQ